MSMPSFPQNGANMTREQAITMIIASIALEERALGRIIDAEGDKLRYVLCKCRKACGCCETSSEILQANKSVTRLLEVVAQNQMLLRSKLALALGAGCECHPACPCPPPKPPCPAKPSCRQPCPGPVNKSQMQLGLSGSGFLWKNECLIPWEYLGGSGNAVRWRREAPSLVELDPGRAYYINCTLFIRGFLPPPDFWHVCLENAGTSRKPLPLDFAVCRADGEAAMLRSALLIPNGASTVSLRLCSGTALCVEQAELNIAEL